MDPKGEMCVNTRCDFIRLLLSHALNGGGIILMKINIFCPNKSKDKNLLGYFSYLFLLF